MNVDAAVFRHIQNLLGEDLPEGGHHENLRVKFLQLFHRLRLPDADRLKHLNALLKRIFLHRRHLQSLASAFGLIRLGHHGRNLMSRFIQRLQHTRRQLWRSHKNDFHIYHLHNSGRMAQRAIPQHET